ncbi:MAG: hypothetical protein V4576_00585 [Patescibacteria group bacterium]
MNKIWFRKVSNTQSFKTLPDGIKSLVQGGYKGFFIPVSKEGWIVFYALIICIVIATIFILTNDFSRATNLSLIVLPLIISIVIAKIKS